MLIKTISAFVRGIEAVLIMMETDVSHGLPSYQVVGQPDTSIRESKERIRLAIQNTGCFYPKGRITVNLSPAEIRKSGSHFDLAIAMGLLAATGQVDAEAFGQVCFLGELSLDGKINPVRGVLPMVMAMKRAGIRQVFVPRENVKEGILVADIEIFGVETLGEVVEHFQGMGQVAAKKSDPALPLLPFPCAQFGGSKDFADVRGQENAKRAIMISVAGGHGLFMVGSPSTGKTMLSERIPTIMPEMSYEEILETTTIYSVAGLLSDRVPVVSTRPFRHPHHKLTTAGLLGGGNQPKPGEITLANKGVLFLDEVGEFDYRIMDALRIPLEKKEITLVRNNLTYTYPADFLLVAASNPCPCGYLGDPIHPCKCSAAEILRYQRRFSGPIMDRIDMHVYLMPVAYDELTGEGAITSEEMKEKIVKARVMQKQRYQGMELELNGQLDERYIDRFASLKKEDEELLALAYERMKLNPRTVAKVRKLARTIADLEGSIEIETSHLSEALQYRERVYEG